MKTIIMDTSNKYLVVALYQDDQCLDFIQEGGNQRQSEYAILRLKELLSRQHIALLDIDQMVITIGPGSYTGERVALTIAKTLATVSNIKIKTVSSLKAYAGLHKAISILDARSKKLYVGVYDKGQDVIEEMMIPVEEFFQFARLYPNYPLVGDVELVGKERKEVKLYETIFTLSKLEDYVEDIDALVPHYIKKVEAKKL